MPNDGDLQASIRALTGTSLDYNGDWSALFTQSGIASGDFNGRMLQFLNGELATSYTNLADAQNAYAIASGVFNWSALNVVGNASPWKQARYQAIDIADSQPKGPSAFVDFRRGQQALTTVASGSIAGATTAQLIDIAADTYSNALTFTRASTATYIDANGVMQTAAVDVPRFDYTNGVRQALVEGAATNLFLNSATGVTQDITTTAQSYSVSFYGTGSITLSGTATGTLNGTGANNRVSLTVTATAGTLTLTVSGSTTLVQVEALPFASSYIPTTSSAVTRAGDIARLGPKLEALLARPDITIVAKGRMAGIVPNGRIVGGVSNVFPLANNSTFSTAVVGWNGATAIPAILGSGSMLTGFGAAVSLSASGTVISGNGSSVNSSATAKSTYNLTTAFLGKDAGGGGSYTWFDQLIIYPFRATNAEVQRLAAAYV